MLLLHLSRTPIFCNKNVPQVREDAGLGSSFDSICGLYRCYHKASVEVFLGEVFGVLNRGYRSRKSSMTGNVPCFHPDFGSKCPGTNIESQHSRALRGQSGAGTGPGDEVKGLSHTTERIWGNFIATIHFPNWSPQKGGES